jgi:hypothetical protein
VSAGDPDRVEEAWLKSLRFQNPSILAQRADLDDIQHRIEMSLARCDGRQEALGEALGGLGQARSTRSLPMGE